VEWNPRSATEKPSEHITVWGALRALALGAFLGIIGVLCSRWVKDSPLLCTALGSVISTMVLAALASARPQDLVLETQGLHSSAQETRDPYRQRIAAQPGFAAW
jgi:hypothetical protein